MAEQGKQKRKGYQWPCSCFTAEEMAILFRLREQTGRPISRLLCDAVRRFEIQNAEVEKEMPKDDDSKE
jgi:hypothetical protein